MNQPKYCRPLNPKQQDILIILYKFRFATVELICQFLEMQNQSGMYERLRVLVDQGYIGRLFSKQDMIDRKPALYHLKLEGINYLKQLPDLNQKALPNMYRDDRRSKSFMDRSLTTLKLHNKLQELYGDKLEFYTKSEISDYDFFPKSLPDSYLLIDGKPYMLEWLPENTLYQSIRSKISQLLWHYDSGEWDSSGEDYPTILFVCANPYLERQVQRVAGRAFYKAVDQGIDPEGLTMLTTTLKALNASENIQETIWSDIGEPDEPVRL